MGKIEVKSNKLTPRQLQLAREDVKVLEESETKLGILRIISESYLPAILTPEEGKYVMMIG